MDSKPVTLVVSDLHMGDGKPGDDFVDDQHQFAKFVRDQAATAQGQKGQIELIINGDFLEFVQVFPEAYQASSFDYWCSERESVLKLSAILNGHANAFEEIKRFQQTGNRVTLFAGNHDVDLYWGDVQERIRDKAGKVAFELGEVRYERYGGRLRISHGHLFESIDPANTFNHWKDPRLGQPRSLEQRLEMCPWTVFGVRVVNLLEEKVPFADNLHPEIALANVLWREHRWGLKTIAWVFARFAGKFPKAFLSVDTKADIDRETEFGQRLREAIAVDSFLAENVARIYREVLQATDITAEKVQMRLVSDEAVVQFVEQLLRTKAPWEEWLTVLDSAKPAISSISTSGGDTLAIRAASKIDTLTACIDVAKAQWDEGAQIVVLGHTHLPQRIEAESRRYYNPGSWTRYFDAADVESLTLEQLQRENEFPYQLNCVRIEDTGTEILISELRQIDARCA